MTYTVVTGADRKEFETIKEALAYKSDQSVIYEVDAFGNARPLSDAAISELSASSPPDEPVNPVPAGVVSSQAPSQEAAIPQQPGTASMSSAPGKSASQTISEQTGSDPKEIKVTVNLQQPKNEGLVNLKAIDEKVNGPEKKKADMTPVFKIIMWIVAMIMVLALLGVAYVVVKPFIGEFFEIMKMDGSVGLT